MVLFEELGAISRKRKQTRQRLKAAAAAAAAGKEVVKCCWIQGRSYQFPEKIGVSKYLLQIHYIFRTKSKQAGTETQGVYCHIASASSLLLLES
jgi:hypothetical protein